jgi:threonine dehydratase
VVDLEAIQRSREHVYRVAHRTPLLSASGLHAETGAELYLKAECLQYTGSFKVRGAANKLASLSEEERRRGVITASAGNHAQGVAVAARAIGVEATVVMPEHATLAKLQAARSYGAEVVLAGGGFGEALARAEEIARERDLVFIPAYNDEHVIAGQGTLGLEIVEDCPEVELVIVPVGGGGLIAGVATAIKALRPAARVIGVQAAASPAAALSLRGDELVGRTPQPTLADGVAVPAPGAICLDVMRRAVDEIATVDEEAIAQAIVLLLERAKIVVEGAGALAVAAMITGAIPAAGKRTVAVLSGGNIDINVLDAIVQHGLLLANRYLTLTVDVDDRPGTLAALLNLIADTGANVLDVDHVRQGIHLPVRGVEVRLLLETRDMEHIEELTSRLADSGYVLIRSEATSRAFRPKNWG